MKIRVMKKTMISIAVALILITLFALSGCGSGNATLESYIDSNEEFSQELEAYCVPGMEMAVDGNTLIYTYKYEQTFDDEVAELMTRELEKAASSMKENYESIKSLLVEKTEVPDITIKVVYTEKNDDVLYEMEY